jgi:hypothetical protein
VQAHSSLSVQLKFKPTIDLLNPAIADLCTSSPAPPVDLLSVKHDDNDSRGMFK